MDNSELIFHYETPPWDEPDHSQYAISEANCGFSAFQQPQIRTLTFTDGTREAVLDFTGESVTYSGDLPVGECAKLFCDAVYEELQPKTCKTCHWYENGSHKFLEPCKHLYICQCPKMVYGYRGIKIADECFVADDDEGFGNGICPRPDFGCIHHRART